MAAVLIQVTPQGTRSSVVEQELVFFIGPSPDNPLTSLADYEHRVEDVRPLLAETGARHAEFEAAVASTYGTPISTLATSLRLGGKRHLLPPTSASTLSLREPRTARHSSRSAPPTRLRHFAWP